MEGGGWEFVEIELRTKVVCRGESRPSLRNDWTKLARNLEILGP